MPDNADELEFERLEAIYRRALRAAEMYFTEGAMSAGCFERLMADCTLRVQGIDEPTHEQVKARVEEMRIGYSFMSPAPATD